MLEWCKHVLLKSENHSRMVILKFAYFLYTFFFHLSHFSVKLLSSIAQNLLPRSGKNFGSFLILFTIQEVNYFTFQRKAGKR